MMAPANFGGANGIAFSIRANAKWPGLMGCSEAGAQLPSLIPIRSDPAWHKISVSRHDYVAHRCLRDW